jgi:hypothetical protein
MEKELILKEATTQINDFRIVQMGSMVESINKLNQVFHFIDLSYTKVDIFYQGWIGYRSIEQMKDVLEGHLIKVYHQNACKNMLIENSRMSGSFSDINNWYAMTYMPKLMNLGLKNIAVVLPDNIFAQLAVKDWTKKLRGFNVTNFVSLGEALSWLALL